MQLYSVINMDIVGSRQVRDREQLQLNLKNYICEINKKYFNILPTPASITLGDEWQLITSKPSESYNLVNEFQQLLWKNNLELYAGIGIGGLSTELAEDIRDMDGPCFHAAREAINIAKSGDKLKNKYTLNKLNRIFFLSSETYTNFGINILDFYYSPKSRISVSAFREAAAVAEYHEEGGQKGLAGDQLMLERTINLLVENNEVLKARMTKKQRDIYSSYSKFGSYRKAIDSGNLKDTIGGISQKLNSAAFFTIQRNHTMVSALLNAFTI